MNIHIAPPDFFVAGGTLRYDAPSYVERPADETLHHLVASGQLCYVLTTRQMGKSSLMNRTARQLHDQGWYVALIDLTSIGAADVNSWYLSMLDDLATQLALPTDAEEWWQANHALSPVKRFTKFVHEMIGQQLNGRVAIFIDEVDTALKLPFSDDFFAAVRAIYNQSLTIQSRGQLSIILLGVAAPNDLIKDQQKTPFNVGERLQLTELSLTDVRTVWDKALPQPAQPILERIFYWTSGHPYLTQKVARTIVQKPAQAWQIADVDEVVQTLFFTERALFEDSNLQFIQGRILGSTHKEALLKLYQQIYLGHKKVANDERSDVQTELKLYGLVKVDGAGNLVVRNQIYRQTFDLDWVRQHRQNRQKQRRQLLIIALLLLLGGLGVYAWQTSQRTDALLAETYRTNFLQNENPTLRLDNLASLLALPGYEAEGIALFNSLTTAEQATIFINATPDLQAQTTTAVSSLYLTLTTERIDETADNTQVLAAMLIALEQSAQTQNSTLAVEINSWLQGRAASLRGDYDEARIAYSVVLSLNEANHAARFERALAQLALEQTEAALDDLTVVAAADELWQQRVRQLLVTQPALHAGVMRDYDALAALLEITPEPTLTQTAVSTPSPAITAATATESAQPSPAASMTPALTATPTVQTAVLIDAPLSVPPTDPEGRIVYTCFDGTVDQICTIDASGNNQQQLTQADRTTWYASASQAANEILYSSLEPGIFTLFRMSLMGEEKRPFALPPAGYYSPAFSPDASQIAFTRAQNGQQQVWVMDVDGSGLRPLTSIEGDILDPAWSPDGQWIAVAHQPPDANGYRHLLIPADGSDNRMQLSTPIDLFGGRSDWSPDGKWLAVYAGPPGDHDIYLLAIDGSEARQLTQGGDNLAPSFSPDGNWLVFTSSRDGDNELFIMRLDGTGLTQLTNNERSDWQPRWIR